MTSGINLLCLIKVLEDSYFLSYMLKEYASFLRDHSVTHQPGQFYFIIRKVSVLHNVKTYNIHHCGGGTTDYFGFISVNLAYLRHTNGKVHFHKVRERRRAGDSTLNPSALLDHFVLF